MKENKKYIDYKVDELGSLGLLALGYKGLKLWREKKEEVKKQKEQDGKEKK